MVEGKRLSLHGRAAMTPLCIGEQIHLEQAITPGDAARRDSRHVDHVGVDRAHGVISARDDEHRSHTRQLAHELHQVVASLMALARPQIGRRAHQDDGIELAEAIDDGRDAELRCGARHHRSDGQARERDDEGVDPHGQHERDAITRRDSAGTQRCCSCSHPLDELLARERGDDADAALTAGDLRGLYDDGQVRGVAFGHGTQVGVDDVERRAREEAGLGQRGGFRRHRSSRAHDPEVIPHERPEGIRLRDRPGMQVAVRGEIPTSPRARRLGEGGHARGCTRGGEHRLGHGAILPPGR